MTWVEVPEGSPFPLSNLPYGVFTTPDRPEDRRIGVAIGNDIVDVGALAAADDLPYAGSLNAPTLNAFLADGPETWRDHRDRLTDALSNDRRADDVSKHLVDGWTATMHLAVDIGDYVDFYASEAHASNVGRMFRPDGDALTPNWKHLPIGYHGRAGSVRVSGTEVIRPCGQRPAWGPTEKLDFEAEVGFVVGVATELGEPVSVSAFSDRVFGACLVNDWSARDIQRFESAPLGPLLGKSFLTSVSPWIVPLAALTDARCPPPSRDVPPLPHLDDAGDSWALDLALEVRVNDSVVSRPAFAGMYWTAAQQLAHLTSNGTPVRTGDLYASGTVSTETDAGCLLELSWNGTRPIMLDDGSQRTFLEDGDTVTIGATAPGADGTTIGFGTVEGTVSPARAGRSAGGTSGR